MVRVKDCIFCVRNALRAPRWAEMWCWCTSKRGIVCISRAISRTISRTVFEQVRCPFSKFRESVYTPPPPTQIDTLHEEVRSVCMSESMLLQRVMNKDCASTPIPEVPKDACDQPWGELPYQRGDCTQIHRFAKYTYTHILTYIT